MIFLDKTGLTTLWSKIKSLVSKYLPLSGGTIKGRLTVVGNTTIEGNLKVGGNEFSLHNGQVSITYNPDINAAQISAQTLKGNLDWSYIQNKPTLPTTIIGTNVRILYISESTGVVTIYADLDSCTTVGEYNIYSKDKSNYAKMYVQRTVNNESIITQTLITTKYYGNYSNQCTLIRHFRNNVWSPWVEK